MISEFVKELREKSALFSKSDFAVAGIAKDYKEAADIIEELSAKLASANMERSEQYCKGNSEFVEKLIGRLEEKQDEYFHGKSDYEEGKYNAYDEVAQIVNQLAEEYNNDFCEWKKVVIDSTELIREPHRMYLFKDSDDKWEYCPYCGKKIKVAPYQPKGK